MFRVPDPSNASHPTQAVWDEQDTVMLGADARIRSGGVVSPGTGLQSDVSAGVAKMHGQAFDFAATSVAHAQNTSGFARFDIIGVHNTGEVAVLEGVAGASPIFPAVPADFAVLASVRVRPFVSSFNANDYVDKRIAAPIKAAPQFGGSGAVAGIALPETAGGTGGWERVPNNHGVAANASLGGRERCAVGDTIVFNLNTQLTIPVGANNTWLTIAITDEKGTVLRRLLSAPNTGPLGWGMVSGQSDEGGDKSIITQQLSGPAPYVVEAGDIGADGYVHWRLEYYMVAGATADPLIPATGFLGIGGPLVTAEVYERIPLVNIVAEGQSLMGVPGSADPDDTSQSTIGDDLVALIRSNDNKMFGFRNLCAPGESFSDRTSRGYWGHVCATATYGTNVLISAGSYADFGPLPKSTPSERTASAATVVAAHKDYITNICQGGAAYGDRYDYVIAMTMPFFSLHVDENTDESLLVTEYNAQLLAETAFFDAIVDVRTPPGDTFEQWEIWQTYDPFGVHQNHAANDHIAGLFYAAFQSLGIV